MGLQSAINLLVILVAILGGSWQLFLKPHLQILGYGRVVVPVNNKNCKAVSVPACEKIILHDPTGIVYLACSNPSSRVQWLPAVGRLNATGASFDDYVATYDPKTTRTTRLKVEGFQSDRGLSLHGMDVVPSSSNPSELFVYLVNHRPPPGNLLAKDVGADSVIEIFKTTVGGTTLTHVKTIEDSVIITPNDVVGSSDGKSFYFTNDHGVNKIGLMRELDIIGRKTTSVGYCHVDNGCHYAIQGMVSNNGIARATNGTIYVANSLLGGLSVLEEQTDNTLVLTDTISTDRGMDNLSIDLEGYVWGAAFPDALAIVNKHFNDPTIPAPSSALRFSINTNPKETPYGIKFKVEKMFEDDGSTASGITSVAYDVDRNLLFLHGIMSPHLTVCKL